MTMVLLCGGRESQTSSRPTSLTRNRKRQGDTPLLEEDRAIEGSPGGKEAGKRRQRKAAKELEESGVLLPHTPSIEDLATPAMSYSCLCVSVFRTREIVVNITFLIGKKKKTKKNKHDCAPSINSFLSFNLFTF